MATALLWYDAEPKPAKAKEFERVAKELSVSLATIAHPVHTGKAMADAARLFEPGSVDWIVANMHGFTTRLLCSSAGVHATQHRPPAVVSIGAFVDAWRPFLADVVKVSLCACCCSQEPRTFASLWGPWAHQDGGLHSFSALLRDQLAAQGVTATVRGHTTAGHVTNNPALREHGPTPHEPGHSLFNRVLAPIGVTPTWATTRRWNNLVRGPLAEAWLLFADGAVEAIREKW
jgi:hypothetical protein